MKPILVWLAAVAGLALCAGPCLACNLDLVNQGVRDRVKVDSDKVVRVFEVQFQLPETDEAHLNRIANNSWFRPSRWFLTYGSSSERLLLLLNYYYGLLKYISENAPHTPLLSVTLSREEVEVEARPRGCFQDLGAPEAEDDFRKFILRGFRSPGTGNASDTAGPYRSGFSVCSMHITSRTYTARIAFRCCKAILDGLSYECRTVENDLAVHVLSGLLVVLTVLVFLFFPLFSPRGYEVNTFTFVPKKAREVNVVVTDHPQDYADLGCNTIHIKLLEKVPAFHEQLTHMETDTMYRLKVGAIKFSTDMDRLLPEKEAPFGPVKLFFDTFVRCSKWRSGPMRDFCQAPVCGECCCCSSTPWQNFVLSVRTLLVLLVLALPSLPFLYAQVVEDAEHVQIAKVISSRGLLPISNFWFGPIAGKVVVGVLAGFYLLHCLMYLCISCARSSDILTYSDLLRNSTVDVSLKSRLAMLKKMVFRTFVPLRRWGLLILPLWLLLLVLTPVLLLLYTIVASPIIKMFVHILQMCRKNWYVPRTTKVDLKNFAKHFFTLIFLFTLLIVFIVIAIGFNFILHVVCLVVINFIINLDSALQIFPVVILFVVYTRDIFKRLVDRYAEFHQAIITKVISLDTNVIQLVASQTLVKQENTAFVIKSPEVLPPLDNVDAKIKAAPVDPDDVNVEVEQPAKPEVPDTAPFLVRYGAPRARMRSLVLFLDKNDVPYIPHKFFFAMTQMTCPGSPGDLSEAMTQALIDLSRIIIFLLLLLVLILAYGDVEYISSGVQFIATVAAGLIPLILRYFFFNQVTTLGLDKENLRFQTQFAEILNGFTQTWDLEDLTIEEVKNEGGINPVATVNVANKDSASSSSKEDMGTSSSREELAALDAAHDAAHRYQDHADGAGKTDRTDKGDKTDRTDKIDISDKTDAQPSVDSMEAVDVATGDTVVIRTSDVIEAVDIVTANGVIADSSSTAAREALGTPKFNGRGAEAVDSRPKKHAKRNKARLMRVKGLFKVDGVLMQALKEFSPFGDEPVGSECDVLGREGNSLKIDLVVDISHKPFITLPRAENKFHYLVRRAPTTTEENIAMVNV